MLGCLKTAWIYLETLTKGYVNAMRVMKEMELLVPRVMLDFSRRPLEMWLAVLAALGIEVH